MWSSEASGRRPGTAAARIRMAVLFLAGVSIIALLACHMDSPGKTYMDVRGNDSWLQFDTLQVILEDASGERIAVLFDRRLVSLGELSKLPVEGYPGGTVSVLIIGKKGGEVVFKEERVYDGRVTVGRDTLVKPPNTVGPKVLDLHPDNLTLFLGGGIDSLQAKPTADWAGVSLAWTTSDSGVVKVSGRGILEATGVGSAYVRAASGENSDQSRVTVVRDTPALDAGAADTAILINSTLAFQVKATQAYGIIAAFAWDLDGDGKWDDSTNAVPNNQNLLSTPPHAYPEAGFHVLRFYVRDGEGNAVIASKGLTVADKVPVLDSLAVKPAVINIKDSAAFSALGSVASGTLAKFAWDYDGDEAFDDSGSLSGSRASIRGGRRFPDSGTFQTRLKLTDAAGTSITERITLQVRLDRPVADAGPDVNVSPGQNVTLHGTATDTLGVIVRREWKLGAGTSEYVATTSGDITFAAPASGSLMCYFRAVDDDGLTAVDSVKVTVTSVNLPTLSGLSPDTLVSIGDSVTFSAKAQAGGSGLKSFNWDFGNDGVADLSGNLTGDVATVTGGRRFPTAGTFTVVLKVSDEAGHVARAEMVVTVRQDPTANAELSKLVPSSGALEPTFVSSRTDYTLSINGNLTDSLSLTPTAAHAGASIKVVNWTVASGKPSIFFLLSSGVTDLTVEVTAADGITTKTYTVKVTRTPTTLATLKTLTVAPETLDKPFSPTVFAYTINTTRPSLTVIAEPSHFGATMLLDSMSVLRANQASNPILLKPGTHVLRLTVTAEDRITKLTYVITVNSPDTVPPSAPLVSVPSKVIIAAPVWTWSRTGGGIGGFRYRFDNPDLTAGAVTTTALTISPNLTDGPHTLYVQEKDSAGNWSASGSASTLVMQGPASWYKFDNGDYLDHGFNGNNGTAAGITSVADRRGVAGRAAYFNGTTSMFTADFVKYSTDTNISISFWIKTDTATPNQSPTFNGPINFVNEFPNAVDVYVSTPAVGRASATVTPGAWTHIVGTYNGATISIYANGVLKTSTAHPGAPWNTVVSIYSGWHGTLDDIRVYYRILSGAEIQTLSTSTP